MSNNNKKSHFSIAIVFAFLVYTYLGKIPELDGRFIFTTTLAVLFFVAVYIVHSYLNLGVKNASIFLVNALVISYFSEYIGVETGLPFGHYVYTSALGQMLGPVPLIIPLLWASLGYFCLIAVPNYLYAPLLLMLLDVSLDPRYSQTLWIWSGPPPLFYGVPLLNFLGWLVVGLLIFGAYRSISRKSSNYLGTYALVFYLLFGLNNSITAAESGLASVAIISGVLFISAFAGLFLYSRTKVTEKVRGTKLTAA